MKTDRKMVKKFLLELIDVNDYDLYPITDNDKILCAYQIACNEVGYMLKTDGRQAMIEYWLSGLCSVISLPYLYAEIIPLAVKFNNLPEDYTNNQADKICQNWFKYMANQFCQMVDKANKESL